MADWGINARKRKLFVTSLKYSSALLLLLYSMSAFAIFSVTPTTLNFGGVGVGGSSGVMTVTFNNDNPSDVIDFTSITATGDFTIVTNNCPTILGETLSCTVDIRFNPSVSGPLAGALTFDGHDHSVILGMGFLPFTTSVLLSGTGLIGDLAIDGNAVDLGSVPLGVPSQPVAVPLSNVGNDAVTINTISATAPFSQTNDCPTTLNAGTSCTIMVSVTATGLGSQTGTLTASGIAIQGTTTQAISLLANAQSGVLGTSSNSIVFPDTPVNTTSSAETVTVTNTGNSSLLDLAVSSSGDFTQTNDCPTTLAANQSCSVSVMASPTTAGDVSGSLDISATDAGRTVGSTVALSVNAITANLVTSETQLSFPDATVDASSQPQAVTVTNQGTAPLTINSITTEGDFSQTNDCGTEVAAGGSCDIQVVFTPQ
ncbi:MAG: choice-of-anchor D domain-containing protein, partial [Candidatus Thiodiazotropha sp.]